MMHPHDPWDHRKAPFALLDRIMPLPGRQSGDARLLLDLERKTKDANR
jgi:hypothetical protein